MIRNLKTMGLALMAVFAFSAVVASAASAQTGKLTSDGAVTLTASETAGLPETANALTSFGSSVRCKGSTYTGHKFEATPHALIPSGETTVTITPTYVNCKATALNLPTTVDMNGCDYVFHLNGKVSAGTYKILATVHCTGGNHIKVTVFSDAAHTKLVCTTTITENAVGYEGLHATNQGSGHIGIKGSVKGIEAHRSGPGCPTETTTTAELHQDLTVKGHNSEGGVTAISLSD